MAIEVENNQDKTSTSMETVDNKLTLETVRASVPANMRTTITQNIVDRLNQLGGDPIIDKEIRDNFITYSLVLREGKFHIEDYVNAVTFCTHKIMGLNNKEAYAKTFPIRYQTFLAKGYTDKDISAFVSAYSKNKMVQSILEKSVIPFHMYNMDARQKALDVQVELMMTAKSEMVRMKAADSVLAHTEAPTVNGPMVNINLNKSSALEDLERSIAELARKQKDAIEDNLVTTKEIAEQKLVGTDIVEAEVVEDNEETISQ